MSDLENRNEKGREEEIKARTRKIVEESLEKKIMEILKKNKEKIKEILFDNDDETREEIKKEEQKFFLNMLLESFPEIFESQKNIENIGDNMLEVKIKKVIEKIKGFFKLKIEKNNEEKQKINKLLLDEKENLAKLCNEIEDLKKEVEEKETKLKEKKEESERIKIDFNGRIEEKEKSIKKKDEEIGILLKNKDNLEKELKQEKEKLEKEIKRKEKLGAVLEIEKLYENYLKISPSVLLKTEKILRRNDLSSFISSCYSIQTLDNIWDFVNNETKNKNITLNDVNILKEIFAFILRQMNKKYEKDYYMLVEPQIGELFDPINHREINGNSTGKISELYFYGYGKLNDSEEEKSIDKLIKAALVCAN